jgi:hypothetical protein
MKNQEAWRVSVGLMDGIRGAVAAGVCKYVEQIGSVSPKIYISFLQFLLLI